MAEKKIFSVLEITRYIKSRLEGDFALRNVRISGEVSDCKEDKKGHLYFTIKDDGAVWVVLCGLPREAQVLTLSWKQVST